jgi:asparagine synthase (glutamine-hydrolysing)
MCGILVVVNKKEDPLDLAACRRALSEMTWRGPDKCVSEDRDGRVFIGQTILSLTGDISKEKDHLRSRNGSRTIAYNGEIYNFRSLAQKHLSGLPDLLSQKATDSEVLVNLHEKLGDTAVPAELDGMFAYSIYDEKTGDLTFSRDTQGEKSLYIYEDDATIVVSSEIRSILILHPQAQVDMQTLRDYFRTRHLLTFDRTAFHSIRQIPPGATIRLNRKTYTWSTLAQSSMSEWIDPAIFEKNRSRSINDLADELDALMTEAVKEMLPEGRKYASVVSGGVDSSLISHYVAKHGSPETLVAVDHVGKDTISDDLSHFEKVLGRKIDTLRIDKAPYSAEIKRCQTACGGPLPSHSFVPQAIQSAHVQSTGCRVLFGGDAADEFFGGYSAYLPKTNPNTAYSPSPYTAHAEPEIPFCEDDASRIQSELSDAWKKSLAAYAHVEDLDERTRLAMMYSDAAYQVPAVGLRGADLMSMMWSIEARTVFIRKRIVRFALNLPLAAKVDQREETPERQKTKHLLKILFIRHFGEDLLAKKQGFAGFPNESAEFLGNSEDFLAHKSLGIKEGFDAKTLSRDGFWKLANIEYFLRSRGTS